MEHECAIPMCGEEGTELIPMCENGHWIHTKCLQLLAESKMSICPMCRSSAIDTLSYSVTVPLEILSRTPFSVLGATLAVCVGKSQRNIIQYQN